MIEFIFDYSWLMFIPFLVGISFNKSSSKPVFKQYPGAYGQPPLKTPTTTPGMTTPPATSDFYYQGELLDPNSPLAMLARAWGPKNQMVSGTTSGTTNTQREDPYWKSRQLAEQLESLLGTGFQFNQPYGPTTASEQDLLNSIMDVTAGRGAVRGLGPPTQTALAQAVAPTLVQNRQQQQELELQKFLGQRGLDIQALLQLIGYAMPEIVGGQSSRSFGAGISLPTIKV